MKDLNTQAVVRKALPALLILALLISAVAGSMCINLTRANPYRYEWKLEREVPSPAGTIPPIILIFTPANQTYYASNNFTFSFNVTLKNTNNNSLSLSELYYVASWQNEKTKIDLYSIFIKNNFTYPSTFSINMTDVSEGPRWIEVYAVATGGYNQTRVSGPGPDGITRTIYFEHFKVAGTSGVNFTIDTKPPKIAVSIENKTYITPDIPLGIRASEPLSEITYSLDGQENITTSGNSTLTELSNGLHNITIYARDLAKNIANSDVTFFSIEVPEPLQTDLASVVIGTSAAALSVGLIFYVKRRSQNGWK